MLEDASIRLSAVASLLTTVSARVILAAVIAGESYPLVLAQLAEGRMGTRSRTWPTPWVGTSMLATRLVRRGGMGRANTVVGHSTLPAAWHMLTRDDPYGDLGPG